MFAGVNSSGPLDLEICAAESRAGHEKDGLSGYERKINVASGLIAVPAATKKGRGKRSRTPRKRSGRFICLRVPYAGRRP